MNPLILVCTPIAEPHTAATNKGGDTLEGREMLDAVNSFIGGFGTREAKDGQNAVFIAKELFSLDFPFEYKGMGRRGVECLRLYRILRNAKPSQKNPEAFHIGKTLTEYDSRELMLMASYLWNEGKNSLREEEREEARALLRKWRETGKQSTKQCAALG
jgi:hypothetical protein